MNYHQYISVWSEVLWLQKHAINIVFWIYSQQFSTYRPEKRNPLISKI